MSALFEACSRKQLITVDMLNIHDKLAEESLYYLIVTDKCGLAMKFIDMGCPINAFLCMSACFAIDNGDMLLYIITHKSFVITKSLYDYYISVFNNKYSGVNILETYKDQINYEPEIPYKDILQFRTANYWDDQYELHRCKTEFLEHNPIHPIVVKYIHEFADINKQGVLGQYFSRRSLYSASVKRMSCMDTISYTKHVINFCVEHNNIDHLKIVLRKPESSKIDIFYYYNLILKCKSPEIVISLLEQSKKAKDFICIYEAKIIFNYSCMIGNKIIVQHMLEKGFNPNYIYNNSNPVTVAIINMHVDIVKLLVLTYQAQIINPLTLWATMSEKMEKNLSTKEYTEMFYLIFCSSTPPE
jgi:hypothetical protein